MPRAIPWVGLLLLPLLGARVLAQEEAREPDVPYVPTPAPVVERMLELADVGPGDYVIDLGSGDGRIVIGAAKRGALGHGVEIDPERIADARRKARRAGVDDRVLFLEQDLFESELGAASVVTLYLFAEVNEKLRPRLLEELRPGTRVVSHTFDMGDWEPDAVARVSTAGPRETRAEGGASGAQLRPVERSGAEGGAGGEHGSGPAIVGSPPLLGDPDVTGPLDWPPADDAARLLDLHDVFLWVVPADAGGRWRWEVAGRPFRLEVDQRFQELELSARSRGRAVEVAEAELRGRRIAFVARADGQHYAYSGRLEGDAIEGTVQVRSGTAGEDGEGAERLHPWSARREEAER